MGADTDSPAGNVEFVVGASGIAGIGDAAGRTGCGGTPGDTGCGGGQVG